MSSPLFVLYRYIGICQLGVYGLALKSYTIRKPAVNDCKCQYKNAQKVENKNVHFPRAIPQPVLS